MCVWNMNRGWLVRISIESLCRARVIFSTAACKLIMVSAVVSVLSD